MSIDEITLAIDSMPVVDIAQIAARALDTSEEAGGLKWKATKFNAGSTGNGTLGLWRVEGTARVKGSTSSWPAVAKGVNPKSTTMTADPNQRAWRELAAFGSGLLEDLPTGMKAVPVYSITRRPDETAPGFG